MTRQDIDLEPLTVAEKPVCDALAKLTQFAVKRWHD
jgi:hypothetical protein